MSLLVKYCFIGDDRMIKKRIYNCLLAGGFWSCASWALPLNEYIDQVMANNPTLQASLLVAQAREKTVPSSFALEDPFFAAGPDEVPFADFKKGAIRYQLSQNITFPGKLSSRNEIAKGEAKQAKASAEKLKRELNLIATQIYYQACWLNKAIEINRQTINLIAESAASAEARYKTGQGNHHDWLLVKIELSILDVEWAKLKRNQQALLAQMNELRNELPDTAIDLPLLQFTDHPSDESTTRPSLENQPEIMMLDAQLYEAKSSRKMALFSYFPDFVLQGMVMHPISGMGEHTKWGIMAGLSLPLYFWQKQSPLYNAAKIREQAVEQTKMALENSLNTEVASAARDLISAQEVVSLYERKVLPLTKLAVKSAQAAYSSRKSSLADLLADLRVQSVQELELFAAHVDVELARLRIAQPLSSPPILRLSPTRPSLFGGGAMPTGEPAMSGDVGMGRGMRRPSQGENTESKPADSGASMRGM